MGVTVKGGNTGILGETLCGSAGMTTGNSIRARMMASGNNINKKPKKKLNYNPREISGQLLRANKSRNAAIVMTRARRKLSALNQARASGQYNDSETRIAIAHARRMVECSRLKVRNLKEEEIMKGRNDRDKKTGEQKKRNEVKRRVRQREQDARVKMALEENQRVLKEKTKRQMLLQKRRMNRNNEQSKILEADLKYLEDQLRNNQSDGSSQYEGASLDLSMEAAQMAELQQIEQQVEIEVELEYAAIDAAVSSMPSADAGAPAASVGGGGAETTSINVTV